MKLLASGCSLIYGSELADEVQHNCYSQLTYPSLVANYKNLEYQCVATPGNGNDAIARSIVKNLDDTVALVIVNWSYLQRFEFNWSGDIGWQNFNVKSLNSNIENTVSNLRKCFFSNITDTYTYYKYLHEIVFLQQYLKARKIPYIFSTADYNAIDYNIIKLLGTEHINLWKAIDFDPWFYWESYNKKVGFLNWANHCQLPTGKHGHPLEQAHCLTFEMIKNKVALS